MRKALISIVLFLVGVALPVAQTSYYPPAGEWARKTPSEVGMDAAKLSEAVEFMKLHETAVPRRDFSDQETNMGRLLASMPTERGGSAGLIIRRGFIVAEFGDTLRPDPTYSVAKSMLATVAGIALDRGLIPNLDSPVGDVVKDGGYDSPQNRGVTWRHHLQQHSEWEGEMFGKNANFIGRDAFGNAEMKPRAIRQPGSHYEYNDVRMNRFALSLLRVFKKPIPDVFRDEVMNPIGASTTWKWVPYTNAYVDIDSKRMASVSGGTRWGGGMWINAMDMARFGYLWLRGGKWGDKQILPPAFVKEALTPGGAPNSPCNGYGYLWWLNTTGKALPGMPTNAYSANGAGSNTITVSPDHDLVIVWRWHQGSAGELGRRVIAAIKPGTM